MKNSILLKLGLLVCVGMISTTKALAQIVHIKVDFVNTFGTPRFGSGNKEKVRVCLFVPDDGIQDSSGSRNATERFLSKIDDLDESNSAFDKDNFLIYVFHVTPKIKKPGQVCDPTWIYIDEDKIGLDAFSIFPFSILIDKSNSKFTQIIENGRVSSPEIKETTTLLSGSTFMLFSDEPVFRKLIIDPSLTPFAFKKQIKGLQDSLSFLKMESDSALTRLKENMNKQSESQNNAFVSIGYTFSKTISMVDGGDFALSNVKTMNDPQFSFLNYPIKKFDKIGYGIGIGYSQFSCDIGKESIIDTVDRDAIDISPAREKYTRIAYAKDLKEHVSISYASLLVNLSIKVIRFGVDKKGGFIAINPGVKISNVFSSTYQAKEGSMSWGGYYPQHDTTKTSFDGDYDYYQKIDPYKERKQLQINQAFVSAYLSIDWFCKLPKKFYFNLGIYGECGSNMLISNLKQCLLSSTEDDYHSLLYRSNKMKLNSYGARIGVSYSF